MRRFDHPAIPVSICLVAALVLPFLLTSPAVADPFSFSTGLPNGLIGTLARQASPGKLETETADDFILTQTTSINHATFTGLLPSGTPLTNITNVEIEFYHVFPNDSANPPSGNVPTRVNSPGDVEIASATRDGSAGELKFAASLVNSNFNVANTVLNGINKIPNQTTGGEGPKTGEEVLLDVKFTTPIVRPADHYFFRPEVLVTGGDFLWLSGQRPTVPPFSPDLQSWSRNSDLKPDWLRIGTDIVGLSAAGGAAPTFNAAFSLDGTTVPEPSTLCLLGTGLAGVWTWRRRRN